MEPLNIPDVLAQRPIIIYGKWKGETTGSITITGKSGSSDFSWTEKISDIKPLEENHGLKYLWVRKKIRMLDDYNNIENNEKIKNEITSLGLKYNLLTNYTSFIAIDSLIRNNTGKLNTIKQPLPLPQGVSDLAIEESSSLNVGSRSSNMVMYCMSPKQDEISTKDSFVQAPTLAEYTGGEEALYEFIKANITYPEEAKKNNIHGVVYVKFSINTKGIISEISIIKSIGYGCDEEAIRIIKLTSGKWIAAKQKGVKITSIYYLPIKFILN